MPIPFSKKSRRNVVRQASENGAKNKSSTRVRLRLRADWHRRNFLTEVLIPSLFTKRSGVHVPPVFPEVRKGEICITWIGHASFLIQTHEVNILIDPLWSKWLKVVKRLKQPGFEIHHLPEIDFVLVTHAHFDHLDRRTLRRVAADQPIVVPIGVGNLVHDLGFLDERMLVIHAIWVDDADMDLLAAAGCTVAHNPICNLRLGSGIMPFRALRDRGVLIRDRSYEIPGCVRVTIGP